LGLARESSSTGRRSLLIVSAVAALIVASVPGSITYWDAWRQNRDLPMIASFEDRFELSRWRFIKSDGELVPEHATAGRLSLRIDLHAGKYPGPLMIWTPNNWRGALVGAQDASAENSVPPEAALVFDVWLSEGPPLDIMIKIVDLWHSYRERSDRYELPTRVPAGAHQIRIPLSEIANAPRTRQMDLSQVRVLQFYVEWLDLPRTLYLDNIHLERGPAEPDAGPKPAVSGGSR
jgi:hypothetical protein